MPDRPIRAYPEQYTPSDLDIRLDMRFESTDGTVYRPPGMRLVAGESGTWTFRIQNHACDLRPGAVINLVRFNYQIAFALQTTHPERRDYCTLETDSSADLNLLSWRDGVNLMSIVVASGVFKKGESCTVRVGDRSQGSVGSEVFWSATQAQFLLAVDTEGSGAFKGVSGNPRAFEVVAHPAPDLLRLLGPTVAQTGEPVDLHLGVFDRNRNPIQGYSGTVAFDIPSDVDGMPHAYTFLPRDQGLKIFEGIRIRQPGVCRIGIRADGMEKTFTSNPMVVSDNPDACVYWGDVHAHGWGDSTMYLMFLRSEKMDPVSRHLQGRRVGRFDFGCPGAMSMDPDKREETWAAYQQACEQLDEPGRYVPFISYEAHPSEGDRQVIFKNYKDEPPPISMRAPLEEVERTYGNRDGVLLEVHIGGAPPRWDVYRPEKERFLEVCSAFGCAEWLLQKALVLGYKPGVCAASDLHLGLMGGPRAVETFRGRFGQKYPMNQRDASYGTGPITAVVAPALNRDSLWEAIEARHSYAVSGARIYLNVTCNGEPAGAEIDLKSEARIAITCHACAPLDRIDLIAGEYTVRSWSPSEMDFSETITLSAENLPGNWIYVRVHQQDGEYAWSSPIYLNRQGRPPDAWDLPRWNRQEIIDLSKLAENGATRYLPDLKAYLEREEHPERFHRITPVAVLDLNVGRCAQFYCYWGEEKIPMSIRWFFDFDIPKIRYDFGWRDYGAYDENDLGPKLMEKYG